MAKKAVKKAKTVKSGKKTAGRNTKLLTLGEIQSSIEEMALMDFAANTKAELKKLGEQLHEATNKGIHIARDIAEDVQKFARNATDLTKIKLDLYNLRSERERLYSLMGKNLDKLNKKKKLASVKSKFNKDFKKLGELDAEIRRKEKQAAKISF